MAIDDSLLKVYALGTEQEIQNYRKKNDQQAEFNAALIVESTVGLLALPYSTPLLLDVVARFGNAYVNKVIKPLSKKGFAETATSSGLVGIIRRLVE